MRWEAIVAIGNESVVAKGGIAIALTRRFNIPVRKIGVGEGIDDLQDFDPKAYVEAMLGDMA